MTTQPLKLILQGPGATEDVAQKIAAMAGAGRLHPVAPFAWRCDDIQSQPVVHEEIAAAALDLKVDVGFVPADLRLENFKLVVMDMDSTLITIECIDEIADMHGLKAQVAEITDAAMRGELDFRDSLQRRVALLKGLDESALAVVFEQRLELTLGAPTMLHALKKAGLRTVLVSGGFTYFTERLQKDLELDVTRANLLEVIDGRLTGRVLGEIVDAEAKMATVVAQAAELGVSPSAAITIGDGANDLQMMSVAGLSVAFRAKPVVQSQASVALNFSGLDGLLNLFR
jgi:phosphoserine phosphatase